MKKFLCILMILISCFSVLNFSNNRILAQNNSSAKACVVLEANSKRVLLNKNMEQKLPMASTTKIMTALITLENCTSLDEVIKVDPRSVGIEGTSIYLQKDEELSIRELLYGLILASGNDASMALAYHVGEGDMNKFVELMNKKVEKLGLKNTNFVNPHGLDAKGHYTSAYDLAVITSEAMKNPTFKEICSTQFKQITGNEVVGNRYLRNKQRLLKTLEGCNGVKSGFTDNAGRCLVTSCSRNNMDLICVVLNCPDMFEESARLINLSCEQYKMTTLLDEYNYITSIPVENGNPSEVKVFSMKKFAYPLKDGEISEISIEKELPSNLTAPIKKEEIVGKILIYFNKDLIFSENIYTMEEVTSLDIKDKIQDIIDKWFYED